MAIRSPMANKFLTVAENGDAFGREPLTKVTLRTYEHALRRAEEIMDKPFEQWEYGDMDEFFARAPAHNLRGSTIRSMANVLRIMFRWGTEAGIYTKPNPMRGMPRVAKKTEPRPDVSPADAEKMLETIDFLLREKREAASDLAWNIPSMDERFIDKYVFIFRFSYYSGIPLKKLLNLRKSDVEATGVWQSTAYGKKITRDFIPVDADLMAKLQQYIDEHPATEYVFYGESGAAHGGSMNQPLGSASAYAVFSNARDLNGFGTDLTPSTWGTAYQRWKDASS